MTSQNQALLRRLLVEGMSRSNASVIDDLVAANYVNHDAPLPVRGPEGFKQLAGMFGAAFPDVRISIEDVFSDGDRVGSRGEITGTHRGEFMGIPPTGKPVTVKYLDLWKVEGGKFVENWVQMDMLGLLKQLGALPS
jgi:predicted ester cyclase